MDGLAQSFRDGKMPVVEHVPQLVYLILDHLSDANVTAGMGVRDQLAALARIMSDKPGSVAAGRLTSLRAQVDGFVALVEDQQYASPASAPPTTRR